MHRSRRVLVAAAATLAVILPACGGTRSGAPPAPAGSATSGAVLETEPSPAPRDPHIAAVLRFGPAAHSVTSGFGSIWVANHHGASVTRIDPATNEATELWSLDGGLCWNPAVGEGSVWAIAGVRGRLLRIDPRTGTSSGDSGSTRAATGA